ncbi:16S rRNA (uracil1498-N3)-methyltransferase [Natronocella acetinitrilica]|uniref:Ribosomal RNA small subunit methyltransferase E n=1 Tax=Natronocella acetinitrilica TaxID=414046 RepID=A0AAE3KBX7_9GAMM|nr:16S rRNA (uracil(1498)-N(3))-methyltransferase [Natronocella acetinitrilica]MCP1675124.1 16S rRNA (uracil1498-N3)-methyltransferase [Natronocella acetinitrilica]
MRCPRIHVAGPLTPGQSLQLEGTAAQHVRVLRLRPDDPITLFDGRGGEHAAVILAVERRQVSILVGDHRAVEVESPLWLTLIQGVGKGDRMDWVVQKAVELGVQAIVPVVTERTVVRLDDSRAEKRRLHWQGVINSACEQCGRNTMPELGPLMPLADIWPTLVDGIRLVLDPMGACRLQDLGEPAGPVHLLVGPEGGLSDREIAEAHGHGFRSVRLGPRVLRTETAGMTMIAAMQTLWGDLG